MLCVVVLWNPKPSTLNPQPSTLNPQPQTLNPQPQTLNPQPSTLNPQPKPQTLNPNRPKFRAFFPLPPQFSFFLLSLGGPFVEFWWCFEGRVPEMCTFEVLGLSCEALAAGPPPFWPPTLRGPPCMNCVCPPGERGVEGGFWPKSNKSPRDFFWPKSKKGPIRLSRIGLSRIGLSRMGRSRARPLNWECRPLHRTADLLSNRSCDQTSDHVACHNPTNSICFLQRRHFLTFTGANSSRGFPHAQPC